MNFIYLYFEVPCAQTNDSVARATFHHRPAAMDLRPSRGLSNVNKTSKWSGKLSRELAGQQFLAGFVGVSPLPFKATDTNAERNETTTSVFDSLNTWNVQYSAWRDCTTHCNYDIHVDSRDTWKAQHTARSNLLDAKRDVSTTICNKKLLRPLFTLRGKSDHIRAWTCQSATGPSAEVTFRVWRRVLYGKNILCAGYHSKFY